MSAKTIQLTDYNIYITNFWNDLKQVIGKKNYSKVVVLVDENTRQHCLPILQQQLQLEQKLLVIEIKAGEQHKHFATCQYIWEQLLAHGIDRQSLALNLGGGVIGDMGGFCAATFKRGIDFVQIPTTLLSQVDASIGGKLGIDFQTIKNCIGLFKNPQAVCIDPVFLKTLPIEEVRSGLAEIIKHSLIADEIQWKNLMTIEDLNTVDWSSILVPSLGIKKTVVEEDPFEKGWRKILNFGHTIGHAVESHALESSHPLLHGEAIAIGMICESYLSYKQTNLPEESLKEITHFILHIYGKRIIDKTSYPDLLDLMTKDKKNENDQINFTMLQSIGNPLINQISDPKTILESLDYYCSL